MTQASEVDGPLITTRRRQYADCRTKLVSICGVLENIWISDLAGPLFYTANLLPANIPIFEIILKYCIYVDP